MAKRKRVFKEKQAHPGLLLRAPPTPISALSIALLSLLWKKGAGADLLRISYPSLGVPQHGSFKSKIMKRDCGEADLEISLLGTRKERERGRGREGEREGERGR